MNVIGRSSVNEGTNRSGRAYPSMSRATGSPRKYRIVGKTSTIDARLIALNARTGQPIQGFGDRGIVDLRKGLRIPPRGIADYEVTSPPAIIGNMVVVGSAIQDGAATTEPSGEVRAFDAMTGALKWSWDPIPQGSSALGADTWKNGSAPRTGAANAWSVIVADPARNLVFVPTSSPSPDYFGGERLGDNLFSNSVVALRADTGARVWHFQTVHHDLWDYDVASPPDALRLAQGRPEDRCGGNRVQDGAPLRPGSGDR